MTDHPRIRGEHKEYTVSRSRKAGSSPHTRGARARRRCSRLLLRIIPAYAGSTKPTPWMGRPWRDHPRIRGEHPIAAKPDNLVMGSSPHTRGAPDDGAQFGRCSGIIPAYAGSTRGTGTTRGLRSDHPRIRGEHFRAPPILPLKRGSSPHTRGALSARTGSRLTFPDHPRIRGEHRLPCIGSFRNGGSSPHTRGALRPSTTSTSQPRIIPAYAGSTPSAPGHP